MNIILRNSRITEKIMPLLFMWTDDPGEAIAVIINHGRASPMRTSKTLLPIVLDTAISPWPKYRRRKIVGSTFYMRLSDGCIIKNANLLTYSKNRILNLDNTIRPLTYMCVTKQTLFLLIWYISVIYNTSLLDIILCDSLLSYLVWPP